MLAAERRSESTRAGGLRYGGCCAVGLAPYWITLASERRSGGSGGEEVRASGRTSRARPSSPVTHPERGARELEEFEHRDQPVGGELRDRTVVVAHAPLLLAVALAPGGDRHFLGRVGHAARLARSRIASSYNRRSVSAGLSPAVRCPTNRILVSGLPPRPCVRHIRSRQVDKVWLQRFFMSTAYRDTCGKTSISPTTRPSARGASRSRRDSRSSARSRRRRRTFSGAGTRAGAAAGA